MVATQEEVGTTIRYPRFLVVRKSDGWFWERLNADGKQGLSCRACGPFRSAEEAARHGGRNA